MHLRGIRRSLSHAAGCVAATCATYACAPRKRTLLLLLMLVALATTAFSVADTRLSREEMMSLKLAEMRNEMQFLMSLYKARQEEVITLQIQLEGSKEGNREQETTLTPAAQALVKNANGTRLAAGFKTRSLLRAPFVNQLLPHLMNNPRSLYPGFHLRGPRNYSDYVLGIPTVRRDKENYLLITLEHLIAGLKDNYENSTLIVVCVGETDLEYVMNVAAQVVNKFPKHVESGLIEVISPSAEFYPDFQKEKPNLGDSARRYRWRTKQNLDAIFLMAYAQTKGTYYLMLEDDVIAKPTYMDSIRKYTTEVSVNNPDWVFIEYCQTGGIGKLFKSSGLTHFIIYLELFYRNMPIDWNLEKYLESLECGIITQKECSKVKMRLRPRYSSSLFQHIGLYSSLKGKIHKIKNKNVATPSKFFSHSNPPLEAATTSIKVHGEWSLVDAYMGVNYFWGIKPKKGDYVEFIFKEPTHLKSFLFRSGNVDHISDKFQNTIVEVTPNSADQNVTTVGAFDEFGLAEGTLKKEIGPLRSISLKVLEDAHNWVILSEISLTPYEDKKVDFPQPELITRGANKSSVFQKDTKRNSTSRSSKEDLLRSELN